MSLDFSTHRQDESGFERSSVRLEVDVERTMARLLAQEDTRSDRRITVEDEGPRRFVLETLGGETYVIEGTYPLSNLLQELGRARQVGLPRASFSADRIFENPVNRLSRSIKSHYWDALTRRVDEGGIERLITDEKARVNVTPRIYVPHSDRKALAYFKAVAGRRPDLQLEVVRLPQSVTPQFVKDIDVMPGVLSLGLETAEDGRLRGVPFVVPGGRFNEMYGWDSYFQVLGLLLDDRLDLAVATVDNYVYQIRHYGKILNANRSYYLLRSNPSFLTSTALAIFDRIEGGPSEREWLHRVICAAIVEYETVWTTGSRLTSSGLSRYYAEGKGMPPEAEPGHFDARLLPYARRAGLSVEIFSDCYQFEAIDEPELDAYFVHDRATRESGHDTTYRLDNSAADLATVDLNALLYKIETDIAETIDRVFDGSLTIPNGRTVNSALWRARAATRQRRMTELMWCDERGSFYDFNFVLGRRHYYESATGFYPLWAGLSTQDQAARLIPHLLSILEVPGGLAASGEASRGIISEIRPGRQWDYPYGWAPHQIMAWFGLIRYGYQEDAFRLAYRWLYMIAREAMDYNGIITEKYDVARRTHKVYVEYGNVGTGFNYAPKEGFGWVNASIQVGLNLLRPDLRACLEGMVPPEDIFG